MLECYFDDSGSHDAAQVAVWGGLIGGAEAFDSLTSKWRALLRNPLEGKPPLSSFHLSHLVSSWGEFEGYRPAERDLVRRMFRDLIVEERLVAVAYIVVVDDWNRATTAYDRQFLGPAKNMAFGGCIEVVAAMAKLKRDHISCYFDSGTGRAPETIAAAFGAARPELNGRAKISFVPVASRPGLQAADMIAYEAYQFGLNLIDPTKHPENPHFVDLRSRMDVVFNSLHEPEVREHMIKWRAAMDCLGSPLWNP